MSRPTTREKVFAAISGERDYQDQKWNRPDRPAEMYILLIEHYVGRARTKAATLDFTVPENLEQYLEDLRKIAALAVAAMERHGAPCRT